MSNIKTKIEKILAKAKGTNNEAEAAVFLAKAEAMMEEHQINIFDLGEDDPIGQYVGLTGTPSSPTWQRHIMNQLARYYGARCVRSRVYRNGREEFDLFIAGPESARITTELMYPFILEQIRKLGRESAPSMGLKPEAAIRRVANAFAHTLAQKNAEKDVRKPATATAAKHALVTVNALDAWMDEQWPSLTKGRGRATSTNAAAREAAGKVSLHRQTGGASALRIGN